MDQQPAQPQQVQPQQQQQIPSTQRNQPQESDIKGNVDEDGFKLPTKNPEEVFSSKVLTQKPAQNNQMIDDNKSQASQRSNSSVSRKRKGSFIERMQEIQVQQQERLNEKRKADMKSVFLENVDYKATKQQLQLIFEDCAKIQRVTILKNPYTNHPKGCAYISFQTQQGVQRALHLSGVTLRNRVIKIHRKRTNLPGVNKPKKEDIGMNFLGMIQNFNQGGFRGRGRGRGR